MGQWKEHILILQTKADHRLASNYQLLFLQLADAVVRHEKIHNKTKSVKINEKLSLKIETKELLFKITKQKTRMHRNNNG